ncbi:HOG (high osmolarity glycerol) pathway protein [Mortierella claussenii]|nr:HOG (high osmolarity glycerol) pathway protein [Mortierella claussenii]
MAPVSLPPCQAHPAAGDAINLETYLTKKRASIHYPDDSTATKRMSLCFGSRCRSLSESWAFSSASAIVSENPDKKDAASSSISTNVTASSKALNKPGNQPDKELLKSLASFLRGEDYTEDIRRGNTKEKRASVAHLKETTTPSGELLSSAGPTIEDSANPCNLVVTVRDFAYPKTHPCHIGLYPPEPEYEESDVEEDEEVEDEEEEEEDQDGEDRTQGHARGLYDFDAENASELSFREGQLLWIHCRQFPGWFLGEMDGKSGLVPENYVQLL